jgi:tetratricopeptide (TPR) repeat protein
MGKNPRRIFQSQNNRGATIYFRGRSHTIVEAATLAIKECKLGNFQSAADIYGHILAKAPGWADAHNNLGNILLAMKQHDAALVCYDKAIALKPDYAEAHNNRGLALHEMKRHDDALASYEMSLALNPGNPSVHNNRGVTLQAMKRYDAALASYDKAIALKPDNPGLYNNRGIILNEMKRYPAAVASYDKAIALRPDYAEAHNNRGLALQEMKRYDDALASFDKAIMLAPDNFEVHNNRGLALHEIKRYDDALASYDKAIALNPDFAEVHNNRGILMLHTGDMEKAEKMFREALDIKPDSAVPFFCLTSIHKYQNADNADLKSIRNLLAKPGTTPADKACLYFALGKIYDDCSLYDEAFECYRLANLLGNAAVSYDSVSVEKMTDNVIDVFSREFLAQSFAFSSDSQSPLFIVGMPRSGTTLAANILSNHRSTATAGELTTMTEHTSRLSELTGSGIPYPQAVQHLTPAVATRLINDYERRLRRDVGSDVLRIIDKHPPNFRHLGFISMLFPKARIIHCTRHPLDTGLSNYFQRFSGSYDYSFDLRNIGHFYGEYKRLMEHWRSVLPMRLIEISYEDMVMNTEPTARKMLEFLGLEWDERCLAPHTNTCAVETASWWQVRQPIYSQSLERWRHYEKHLAPLKEALKVAEQIRIFPSRS